MPINFPNKPGLVIYITAGDPDLATTRDIALAAIDNGADVIELGVPFSDPLADGPVIQRATERAVARGTRLTDVLAIAKDLRAARPNCGLVLFSYLNPVVRLGMEKFCAAAAEAGADGVLLTDMIVEEAGEYLESMRAHNLAPIFLAAPTSPDARLKAIAAVSQGFVYAISRVGITGTQQQVAGDASATRSPPAPVHQTPHRRRLRHLQRRPRQIRRSIRRRRHHRQRPRSSHRKDPTRPGRSRSRQLHRRPPRMTPTRGYHYHCTLYRGSRSKDTQRNSERGSKNGHQ